MASATTTLCLRIRLPWWWRLLIEGALLSMHLATLVGLPIRQRHAQAVSAYCVRTIASRIRTTVVRAQETTQCPSPSPPSLGG